MLTHTPNAVFEESLTPADRPPKGGAYLNARSERCQRWYPTARPSDMKETPITQVSEKEKWIVELGTNTYKSGSNWVLSAKYCAAEWDREVERSSALCYLFSWVYCRSSNNSTRGWFKWVRPHNKPSIPCQRCPILILVRAKTEWRQAHVTTSVGKIRSSALCTPQCTEQTSMRTGHATKNTEYRRISPVFSFP